MRILIVEDEPDIRQFLADTVRLQEPGAEVIGVADGMAGIRSLAIRPPDGILLDMLMPDMDGWEFLQILDAMEVRYPIVILTAVQRENASLAGIITTYSNVLAIENKPLSIEQIGHVLGLFRKAAGGGAPA